MPIFVPRYTPEYDRLAALYTRGGEQLADIALRRGQMTSGALTRLASMFAGYHDALQQRKATATAQQIRRQEQDDERRFTRERDEAARKERETERKADREAREADQNRAAARWAVDNAAPGPQSRVLAELATRFPETAARFRNETTLPARVTTGAVGAVDPTTESYPVLEPSADQVERARERASEQAARDAALKRQERLDRETAADRAADNARADKQLAATIAASTVRATPEKKIYIRDGKPVPLTNAEVQPGDVPYSAEAMQGAGGEASDVRATRVAAALNSIDKLKKLAPKRLPGLPGMVQGAGATAAGVVGYNTQARQYNALLQPTAMQMAVAVQGAAGLSNSEREAMAKMLGSISTMDYESQMALLENASEMIRGGGDVALVTVTDPKTRQPVQRWVPMRSRMPGSVTIGQPSATTFEPGSDPAGLFTRRPGGGQ